MKKKNQHVVTHGDGWAVRKEGSKKVTKKTETQKEAIEIGREIAKNQESELFIHKKDGRIRERDSYGHDDPHSKG